MGFLCHNGVFDVQMRGSRIFLCGGGFCVKRERKKKINFSSSMVPRKELSPPCLPRSSSVLGVSMLRFLRSCFILFLSPLLFFRSDTCRSNLQARVTTKSTCQPARPPASMSPTCPPRSTPRPPTPRYFSSLVLCARSTPPWEPCVKAHGAVTHRPRLAMTLRINCWGSLAWGA